MTTPNDHITRAELLAALRAERLRMAEACEAAIKANDAIGYHGQRTRDLGRLAAELRREPVATTCDAWVASARGSEPLRAHHCGNPMPCPLHPAPKPLDPLADVIGPGARLNTAGPLAPAPKEAHKVVRVTVGALGGAAGRVPLPVGHTVSAPEPVEVPSSTATSSPPTCSSPAPVPRGHCGRCDRCGRRLLDTTGGGVAGVCFPDYCATQAAAAPGAKPRTHCAGCGAAYQEEPGQDVPAPGPRAEPTGAAIAFGPVSKWDKLDSDLGCYCGETERCIRYRHDRWPALHASEAALRAEVERLRGIYDSAVAGRAKFRATLKAARDEIKQARAMLYVLIDEHGTDLSLAELIQRAEEDVNAEHDRAVQAEGTIVELRGNAEHDGRAFVVERHRAELLQAERDALRAARDRALAVLDAGHTAAYDLVADVREALKLP